MTALAYGVFAVLATAFVTVGYLFGLRRFAAVARGELEGAERRTKPTPTVVHSVLLDGVSNSGKSTLIHRFAAPCADRKHLEAIVATQHAYRTRPVPVGVEWAAGADGEPAPGVLHAVRFRDVSGEKYPEILEQLQNTAKEQRGAAERGLPPAGAVALWVWDMADPMKSRREMSEARLVYGFRNNDARRLIRSVVVFLNKIDALPPDDVARLAEQETEHIRDLVRSFGDRVELTFVAGSALDGRGVTDCLGAILGGLGLGGVVQFVEEPLG